MMNLSIRGWMLPLTLPLILAGSAWGQATSKTVEGKAQAGESPVQGEAIRQGLIMLDRDTGGVVDLYTANAWSKANQDYIRLWRGPGNDDVGAELTPVDASLRAQLNLPMGQGLVVTNVAQDGRAAKVGLKANDILLTLADTSLNQPDDLLSALKARGVTHPNEPIELKLLRGGKPASVKIRAEVRVALAAAAEEKPNYYIGVPSNPLDETFRAHLDIPAGTGLVVGQIDEGTPAAKAGVKYGDILLAFAGEPLPDEDSLRAKIQAKGPHPAKIEVLRAGKPMTLTVTPEPRKLEGWLTSVQSASGLQSTAFFNRTDQGSGLLQNVPLVNRIYTTNPQLQGGLPDVFFVGSSPPAPADLNKKIDELTAQVQALTKAVEDLRKSSAEKK